MENEIVTFGDVYGKILISAGIAFLICAAFYLAGSFAKRKILPWVQKKVNPKAHPIASTVLIGFDIPVSVFLKVCGLCCALLFFVFSLPENPPAFFASLRLFLPNFLYKTLRISSIVFIAWGLLRSSKAYTLVLRGANRKLNLNISDSVTRFLTAIFNVVVVSFAAVIIITEFGYNISALIAGLGLGGLTIALAAKDSAANFFGGLVLVTERPFEIGDWISCAGIEGTVEDISLRSTKIRTGPGSLTTVPNATLSNADITNWSGGMEKRRARFKVSLLYNTPEKNLKEYLGSIRTMLETDPEIQTDSIMVNFTDLAEFSLDITITYFTVLPGYDDFLRIKERVNFSLLSLAEKAGVTFAYPSRTIYSGKPAAQP